MDTSRKTASGVLDYLESDPAWLRWLPRVLILAGIIGIGGTLQSIVDWAKRAEARVDAVEKQVAQLRVDAALSHRVVQDMLDERKTGK